MLSSTKTGTRFLSNILFHFSVVEEELFLLKMGIPKLIHQHLCTLLLKKKEDAFFNKDRNSLSSYSLIAIGLDMSVTMQSPFGEEHDFFTKDRT